MFLQGLEMLQQSSEDNDDDDRMSSYFSDHENSVQTYQGLSQVPGGLLELFNAQKREPAKKITARDFYF